MFVALRLLITIVFVMTYFSKSVAEERPPSVKDCKIKDWQTIDCRNMGFLNIPYDIFSTHRKIILLSGNPFICDCSMVWFLREPVENIKRISDLARVKCAYPDSLNMELLSTLDEWDMCHVDKLEMKDYCTFQNGEVALCRWYKMTRMPFDAFDTKGVINMYLELPCDCDAVWLIRRLKSKENRQRFTDYQALICKTFKKSKVMSPVTDFTEQDVCPQKAPNRCKERPSPCPKTATCSNTGRSFKCVDINECLSGKRVCGKNEECHNKENGYDCPCKSGYVREEDLCVPPNPCKSRINPCPSTATCEVIRRTAYEVEHRCVDIDECSSGDYTCGNDEECYDKENGYECRCKKNMRRENGICISTIDPCKKRPPVCDMKTQHCLNGKNFNFYSCQDIDECATGQYKCDANSRCVNTVPGYRCQCNPGYKLYNGRECKDIDECHSNNDCGIYSQCKNTPGSYKCFCQKGYERNGKICQDIDECDKDVCPLQSTCENTPGSYSCKCLPGYKLKQDECLDIDECKTKAHACGANSYCINKVGGHQCHCIEGYEFVYRGRVCLKKVSSGEANGEKISLLLIITISVSIFLLVIGLVLWLYFQRKKKVKKSVEDKDENDLLLEKTKKAAQQNVFMFNPQGYGKTNALDDISMILESSEEEVDYDYDKETCK